jgi:hypothetical protein
MYKLKLKLKSKSLFSGTTTKATSQTIPLEMNVNIMLQNILVKFHKPIYITFKSPNTPPMYNKKPLMSSFF